MVKFLIPSSLKILLFWLVFLKINLAVMAQDGPKIRDASTKERKDSGMRFALNMASGLGDAQFYQGVGGSFGYQWRLGSVFSVGTQIDGYGFTLSHPSLFKDSRLTVIAPCAVLKFNFNPVRYKTFISPYAMVNPGFVVLTHETVENLNPDLFGSRLAMTSYSKLSWIVGSGLGIEFFPGKTINLFAQANLHLSSIAHFDPTAQDQLSTAPGFVEESPFVFYSFAAGLGINLK
jgi:hypothetical protein